MSAALEEGHLLLLLEFGIACFLPWKSNIGRVSSVDLHALMAISIIIN